MKQLLTFTVVLCIMGACIHPAKASRRQGQDDPANEKFVMLLQAKNVPIIYPANQINSFIVSQYFYDILVHPLLMKYSFDYSRDCNRYNTCQIRLYGQKAGIKTELPQSK